MPGKRNSKKREAILEVFQSTKNHPGAQWVYDKLKPTLPGLSLGTVYRNINFLVREGKLASVGVINGEEHFDGFPAPHAHAICTRCGCIMDIPEETETELHGRFPIEILDFTIDLRNTVFYGLCKNCKSSG